MQNYNKPQTERDRALCILLGAAMNRKTIDVDGTEYAVTEVVSEHGDIDRYFYNPLVDGNEALELLEQGGFQLFPNPEHGKIVGTKKWVCVFGSSGVPGDTVNEAICLATYAYLAGQSASKIIV